MTLLLDQVPGLLDWLRIASIRMVVLIAFVAALSFAVRAAGVCAQAALWRVAMIAVVAITCVPASLPETAIWHSSVHFEPIAVASGPAPFEAVTPRGVRAIQRTLPAAPVRWAWFAALVWALGAAVALARFGLGSVVLWRRIRRSRPLVAASWQRALDSVRTELDSNVRVALRTTTWPGGPVLCGLFRPTVLLPADCEEWSSVRRRAVLTHELLHVVHRDAWIARLTALLRIVFWFHPAVWYASRETARLQELRCDAEVVRSGVDAIDYAESLVEEARSVQLRSAQLALPFARRPQLEERVRRILSRSATKSGPRVRLVLTGLVLVSSLVSAMTVHTGSSARRPLLALATPSTQLELCRDLRRLHFDVACAVRVRATPSVPTLRVSARHPATARAFLDRLDVRQTDTTCSIVDPTPTSGADVRVELWLPRDVELSGTIASGDFVCDAALMSADIRVSIGWIWMRSRATVRGPVHLQVGNGSIDALFSSWRSPLHIACSRGDVAVTLGTPRSAAPVRVVTARGRVSVRVPDAAAFDYEVECPLGLVDVPERVSPRAVAVCRLRASAGSVTVRELP